jgi:hypothetical protein
VDQMSDLEMPTRLSGVVSLVTTMAPTLQLELCSVLNIFLGFVVCTCQEMIQI